MDDKTSDQINKLLNERRFKEASAALKKILLKQRDSFSVYISLGWLYDQWALDIKQKDFRKKRQSLAKGYFCLVIKKDKKNREAIRGLATVLMHEGKFKRALKYYLSAHKIQKTFNTYNDLGNLYQKMKKHDLALKYYKKSLALVKDKEESVIPLYNLVRMNKKIKDKEKTNGFLKKMKKLAKKSEFAKEMLIRVGDIS